jgi:hypothetical protein
MYTIFYGDGSEYSGPPEDAPARDVQVIAQKHPLVGIELIAGKDYYIWDNGRWRGVDTFGMFDYLIEPGWKRVLMGRTMLQSEFRDIFKKADIKKTGWTRDEALQYQDLFEAQTGVKLDDSG